MNRAPAIAALAILAGLVAGPAVGAPLARAPAHDIATIDRSPPFSLQIGDRAAVGAPISAFVMPGETLALRARRATADAELVLQTRGHGVIESEGATRWRWRAPDTPGHYRLTLHDRRHAKHVALEVFVQTPYDRRQPLLNGYRIGHYQPDARRGDAATAPPTGLVAVTPANRDTRISTHFTLGDFLCHQQPAHWPKYVLIQPRLLDKLERLAAALGQAGVAADAITVMSGYRTPWYNADIGNTTVYSQHLFGGAADIFVDADDNGRMDDLDADGRVDTADARWLADLVETVTAEYPALVGGLSAYPANAYHGPFVHLDVRGVAARW